MIYEFITPSDPITFTAEDPRIAFVCGLVLGNAKAGVRSEKDESLPTLWLFSSKEDTEAGIIDFLGCPLREFVTGREEEIAACFDTFAYGSIADRRDHDAALRAITDPAKLAEFRAHHEDQRRTSMSRWVQHAWNYARSFRDAATPRD